MIKSTIKLTIYISLVLLIIDIFIYYGFYTYSNNEYFERNGLYYKKRDSTLISGRILWNEENTNATKVKKGVCVGHNKVYYGSNDSYNYNYITDFSKIKQLQKMFNSKYIYVSIYDLEGPYMEVNIYKDYNYVYNLKKHPKYYVKTFNKVKNIFSEYEFNGLFLTFISERDTEANSKSYYYLFKNNKLTQYRYYEDYPKNEIRIKEIYNLE